LEDTTGVQTQDYLFRCWQNYPVYDDWANTVWSYPTPLSFEMDLEIPQKWYRDAGAANVIIMALVLKTTLADSLLILGEMGKGCMRFSDYGVAATPAFISSEISMCALVL
jgi:hypothetical protein